MSGFATPGSDLTNQGAEAFVKMMVMAKLKAGKIAACGVIITSGLAIVGIARSARAIADCIKERAALKRENRQEKAKSVDGRTDRKPENTMNNTRGDHAQDREGRTPQVNPAVPEFTARPTDYDQRGPDGADRQTDDIARQTVDNTVTPGHARMEERYGIQDAGNADYQAVSTAASRIGQEELELNGAGRQVGDGTGLAVNGSSTRGSVDMNEFTAVVENVVRHGDSRSYIEAARQAIDSFGREQVDEILNAGKPPGIGSQTHMDILVGHHMLLQRDPDYGLASQETALGGMDTVDRYDIEMPDMDMGDDR